MREPAENSIFKNDRHFVLIIQARLKPLVCLCAQNIFDRLATAD